MKLNHLLPEALARGTCIGTKKRHVWNSTGRVEAKLGGHVFVEFYCTRCKHRASEFLTQEQYITHERNLI